MKKMNKMNKIQKINLKIKMEKKMMMIVIQFLIVINQIMIQL